MFIVDRQLRHYNLFVSCLRKRIKDNKGVVNHHPLRNFLFKLDAFVEENRGRLLYGIRASQAFDGLGSVDRILDVVAGRCASFFHYGVLLELRDEYCADYIDTDADLRYEQHFRHYIRGPMIAEFFKSADLKMDFVTETKQLTFRANQIKMSSKLLDIVDLRSNLAALLGLKEYTLHLIGVEEGSVTFLIPKSVANILFVHNQLSLNVVDDARYLSILSLQCENIAKVDIPEGDDKIIESGTKMGAWCC